MGELPKKSTVWNSIKPFVNGGASGMLATCVIQPIDMVKVRIQLGAHGSPVSGLPLLAAYARARHVIHLPTAAVMAVTSSTAKLLCYPCCSSQG